MKAHIERGLKRVIVLLGMIIVFLTYVLSMGVYYGYIVIAKDASLYFNLNRIILFVIGFGFTLLLIWVIKGFSKEIPVKKEIDDQIF